MVRCHLRHLIAPGPFLAHASLISHGILAPIQRADEPLPIRALTLLIVKVESAVPTRTLEGLIEEAKKYCFVSRTIMNPCPIEYVIV